MIRYTIEASEAVSFKANSKMQKFGVGNHSDEVLATLTGIDSERMDVSVNRGMYGHKDDLGVCPHV